MTETERLRQEQAAAVMPFIGPLMDAWDGMPNDEKQVLRDSSPTLCRALDSIRAAVESEGATCPACGEAAEWRDVEGHEEGGEYFCPLGCKVPDSSEAKAAEREK